MSEDSNYDIDKPLKDKNWLIFPNSMFSQLETMDCNDAMEGKCYTDKTFDQCISACEKSPECNFGYYISDLPGDNICVPLRENNIDSNPMYRIRRKDIYSVLDKATTKVFINKQKYPFPPEDANTVFFTDNFTIQNTETNMLLETSPMSQETDDTAQGVKFTKNGDLIVQVMQVPPNLSTGVQYVPLKYGDPMVFNIPDTTLIMRENSENNSQMEWIPRSADISESVAYNLRPVTPNKKMGDTVSYSDTFSIHANVYILGIDGSSSVEKLYYDTHKQAKDKNENVTFRFYPKMKGWYCADNNKCEEIALEDMTINNKGIGTHNGLAVGRNPGCFGVCKYKLTGQPRLQQLDEYNGDTKKFNIWWILGPLIILLVICAVILFKPS